MVVQNTMDILRRSKAFHLSGVDKWVPVIAGKAKAGMAHSDCRWTSGCAGKTVKSLKNTCHTWALLWWWFTTKRSYIKCMDLFSFTATVHMWDVHGYALLMSSYIYYCCSITFNAFTLLVVWREGRPACKQTECWCSDSGYITAVLHIIEFWFAPLPHTELFDSIISDVNKTVKTKTKNGKIMRKQDWDQDCTVKFLVDLARILVVM